LGFVVALHQRGTACAEARAAEAQRLGTEAMADGDLARSLLLARQGVALDDTPATRSNLFATLLRTPAAVGVFHGAGDQLNAVDVDPTSGVVAAGDGHGRVFFFDPGTRRRVGRPYVTRAAVDSLLFSPDGTRLAVVARGVDGNYIDLVDVRTRRAIAAPLPGKPQETRPKLLFSPDSARLAATFLVASETANLLRWSAQSGRALPGPKTIGGSAGGELVGYASDGKDLVTLNSSNGRIFVRDAVTLQPIHQVARPRDWLVAATNGQTVAVGGGTGAVDFVDLRTGSTIKGFGQHRGAVWAMRFTPNGHFLVTVGDDGGLIVWHSGFGEVMQTIDGHTGRMTDVAVAPDGRTAYTASESGGVIAWDLAGTRGFRRRLATGFADTTSVPATPDGARFVIANESGMVSLFDSRTLMRLRRFRVWTRPPNTFDMNSIALSPDGHTLATASRTRLAFWDLSTQRRLAPPLRPGPALGAPRFGGHGRWLVTRLGDHDLGVWDVRARTMVAKRATKSIVRSIATSTRSDRVAVGVAPANDVGGEVEILTLPDLKLVRRLDEPAGISTGLGFSPDDRLLAVGGQGATRLYDTRSWEPQGRALAGHKGATIDRVAFSPDGRMLATAGGDGTVRLWDVESQNAIGAEIPVDERTGRLGLAFALGGSRLITVSDSGAGFAWDLRPETWMREACAIAGRTLTRDEWSDVLPRRDYQPTCR
jgi:WD40 repeat protein